MLGRSWGRFALLVALFVFAVPAVAGAAIKTISGNPLTVHLDSRGQVQVLQFGQNSFSFYNPGSTIGLGGLLRRAARQPSEVIRPGASSGRSR